MNEDTITLMTLDYPPEIGGVSRYLSALVKASKGAIRVIVPEGHRLDGPGTVETRKLFRLIWPHWWPMVGVCRKEKKRRHIMLVSHVFPVGTAAWISRMLGGPEYIVIYHGLDVRLARGRWKRWLLRRVSRCAWSCIANSESTKLDLVAIVPGLRVTVLTPGVEDVTYPTREAARRSLGIGHNEKVVVTVSRLIPRKGVDFSISAMADIQQEIEVQYVIIGDGSYREHLQSLAETSRARIRWIPHADDDHVRMWLAASDVFLLPTRDEGIDVEGFGIVYLEAALAGIPAIAGRSGGAVEAVRHERTGLLVHPEQLDEIVEALTLLLTDESLRHRLGEAAKRRAKSDFRWNDRWSVLSRACGVDT
ncbi:glycosyltransferase family 4 protein [Patescibacteria group bacterium]|nr:glycosyltransferase family 4 protein [Patescibacteria group bacterium]MBU1448504.1 glycosyltransferase family 4 protein [Patescibacteria group bacterium]MBU2613482.1 glycosyltransferase family 4 protein [Patescibacteria group bacterium]